MNVRNSRMRSSAYSAAYLIRCSYSAGLAHADALRRLTAAAEVDVPPLDTAARRPGEQGLPVRLSCVPPRPFAQPSTCI